MDDRYPEIAVLFRIFPLKAEYGLRPIAHGSYGARKTPESPKSITVKARRGCQRSHIMMVANGFPPESAGRHGLTGHNK